LINSDHTTVCRHICEWLHEEDEPEVEKFRRDKNCGTHRHPMTDLGEKCPWSCRDYNDCSQLQWK